MHHVRDWGLSDLWERTPGAEQQKSKTMAIGDPKSFDPDRLDAEWL